MYFSLLAVDAPVETWGVLEWFTAAEGHSEGYSGAECTMEEYGIICCFGVVCFEDFAFRVKQLDRLAAVGKESFGWVFEFIPQNLEYQFVLSD